MTRDSAEAGHTCPACGEPMYVDEEWRLRAGLSLDELATSGDYVHDRCWNEDRQEQSSGDKP